MNTETVKISNCSENEETCDAGKIGVFFGIVEALLYVSGEPVSITELQRVLISVRLRYGKAFRKWPKK